MYFSALKFSQKATMSHLSKFNIYCVKLAK